ncbi:unnamed protein product, partial [Meganyctiphanes norvegica]
VPMHFEFEMRLIQILFMTFCLQEALCITCYRCTNDVSIDDNNRPFDPDCGSLQYDGITVDLDYDYCIIVLWENGALSRGVFNATSGYEDGECRDYLSTWGWGECLCTQDLCNTGNFCEQCDFPWVPPTTAEQTTTAHVTTTPITATSTSEPEATTTEGSGLICYHCADCSNIDDSIPVIQDSSFSSCVSTVFLNSEHVIRGGSKEPRPDGECEQFEATFSCWCSSDNCNDQTFSQIMDLSWKIINYF